MYWLLFYDYSSDYMERRTPIRPEHFAWASEFRDRGELLIAGAYADPADGATLVFKSDSRDTVERFVAGDPYRREGLVTGYQIREWTVVLGGDNDVSFVQ
jgi:uncharacterized protein YciI